MSDEQNIKLFVGILHSLKNHQKMMLCLSAGIIINTIWIAVIVFYIWRITPCLCMN